MQVEPFVGRFVSPDTFETVRAWQLGILTRHSGRFQERVGQGRIRDGHGDLRLEHVYFEDAEPIVIDCVEFNERLRRGDAAADVAFLAMELTARSRADLAEQFLAAFALASDDHDLYGVVDFYAGVPRLGPWEGRRLPGRRLVDATREGRPESPGGTVPVHPRTLLRAGSTRRGARHRRRRVDRQRQEHAGGGPRPSRRRACRVVGSDPEGAGGVRATERAPEGAYSAAFSARTFDEVFRRAVVVLDSGRGVVLDATFRERALRFRARELAGRHGRRFLFVETICDEAALRERLRRREAGPSVSDAGEALLDRVRAEFEPVTELGGGEHVRVDTTGPPDATVRAAREALLA